MELFLATPSAHLQWCDPTAPKWSKLECQHSKAKAKKSISRDGFQDAIDGKPKLWSSAPNFMGHNLAGSALWRQKWQRRFLLMDLTWLCRKQQNININLLLGMLLLKDQFRLLLTVACLVAWPLNENEAGGDLALKETFLIFLCKVILINNENSIINKIIRKAGRCLSKQNAHNCKN